ncbi:phosphoglucosamine mutase [Lutimaribacter sp. EGI FJ00015]|uniref:Phosphoglucosamine mutase n=1 Tax=Lutimaribacter degradans TaxID=2945989 RepID=A0ACC6A284_9RHOB|nr:phosphoglucosamine mutase [Lutimaribacter sp. EGI FJ00013]MCM2563874.1 phosphoglucosamine mutase [Lutimaribacter sp. EGI FJ00013]MCO0615054.1 phosphoglucosamine mutase [Lutimaribacter sp. EGI FJ00015]MCO0637699.1 phosphoglucosamine mutase [Lutimaribacter sp. EGI FJ00014]
MTRKYFGTDGIRGRANTGVMTAGFMVNLASAVGTYFNANAETRRVVIGKDTRRSCYMLENALTAGFTATGMDVFALGPLPTPAVGLLTHSMRADLGVMISASHNPFHDNGIKFFGPEGYKLSDHIEREIEVLLDSGAFNIDPDYIGRVARLNDSVARYVEYAKTTVPGRIRLNGLKVVLDCANGAAYKAAPEVLWELGAEVITLGVSPNGYNINRDCGSTQPQAAARMVRETGADVAICLDGDADRIIMLDETGAIIDGDQIMALLATRWAQAGRLRKNTLVATAMSNLGLETYLAGQGITLKRTDIGDRYVVQEMRDHGYNLGGEQSGHIVMTDHATTGDGLVAGLQVLAMLKESGDKASRLTRVFEPVPQILENVRYTPGQAPLDSAAVQAAIADGRARLGDSGRLLIRKSGTESLIRVMGEAHDETLLREIVTRICDVIRDA